MDNIQNFINAIEEDLSSCCDEFFYQNSDVANAAKYSLLNGGKRIRAVLLFLTAQMCGQEWKNYVRFASAVEMIHAYSLIHDDLPCMDNDDFRRGKPSCHKVYGDAIALLAGDALLTASMQAAISTKHFNDYSKVEAIKNLSSAAGAKGMIYGQEIDMKYENSLADKETLNIIHENKTGKLISVCASLGSLDADLTSEQKQALSLFFSNVGLVFQIIDDILDVECTTQELGKPAKSDEKNNKSTFITLYGLQQSKDIANKLTQEAIDTLSLQFEDNAKMLIEYTKYLLNRRK